MKLLAVFLGVILLLTSCVDDHGNRVQGGELTVYFDRDSDLDKAKQVANYWKVHDLLTGREQDLKLSYQDSTYFLLMIKNENTDLSNIDFTERRLLLELQKTMQDSLFEDESIEIIISDDHFKPLMNIND